MYCQKCGNIMPDNSQFCDKCGASTGEGNTNASVHTSTVNFEQAKDKLNSLEKNKYFYVLSIISLLVLALLPMVAESLKVDVLSINISGRLYEGSPEIAFVAFLLFIGSATIIALPLITDRPFHKIYFWPGIIVKALFFIMYFGVYDTFVDYVHRFSEELNATFTFTGWLIIFVGVAGFIADIIVMRSLKQRLN